MTCQCPAEQTTAGGFDLFKPSTWHEVPDAIVDVVTSVEDRVSKAVNDIGDTLGPIAKEVAKGIGDFAGTPIGNFVVEAVTGVGALAVAIVPIAGPALAAGMLSLPKIVEGGEFAQKWVKGVVGAADGLSNSLGPQVGTVLGSSLGPVNDLLGKLPNISGSLPDLTKQVASLADSNGISAPIRADQILWAKSQLMGILPPLDLNVDALTGAVHAMAPSVEQSTLGIPIFVPKMTLPDGVDFSTGSSTFLSSAQLTAMQHALEYLKENPAAQIQITGHARWGEVPKETMAQTQARATARANAAAAWLVNHSIKPNRLQATGADPSIIPSLKTNFTNGFLAGAPFYKVPKIPAPLPAALVGFAPSSANITMAPAMLLTLQSVLAFLKENPNAKLRLAGSTLTAEPNPLELSKARATSVAAWLVGHGVKSEDLVVIGLSNAANSAQVTFSDGDTLSSPPAPLVFAEGQTSLPMTSAAMGQLNQLLNYLKQNPPAVVQIQGASSGTEAPGTGAARAKSVADWLVNHGVKPARFVVSSLGSQPHVMVPRRVQFIDQGLPSRVVTSLKIPASRGEWVTYYLARVV